MSGVIEAVGLGLAIPAAIETAAKGFLLIQAFFETDNGTLDLALEYHTQKVRFDVWSEYFKVDHRNPSPSILTEQPPPIKDLIIKLLGHIKNAHEKAEQYIGKTKDLAVAPLPPGDVDTNLYPESGLVAAVGTQLNEQQRSSSQRFQFSWHIRKKSKFQGIKDTLKEHIDGLWDIMQVAQREVMARLVATYVITGLSEASLQSLQRRTKDSDNLVHLEARLKQMQLHQSDLASNATGSATTILAKELSGFRSSETIIYSKDGVLSRPVWLDWIVIDSSGNTSDQVVKRVKKLSIMLEAVDEAALHIPPCLGLYEDLDFRMSSDGKRRLGYVFGIPEGDNVSDLGNMQPITLRALIKATKDKPPLLGERFRLAFALASAFGLFHATGWLHKGFQAENIIFFYSEQGSFAKTGNAGIRVKDPYIKGFQYSRPHGEVSTSYKRQGNPESDYYFHPNTCNGFTKCLDLYSLGVVLWEVGRWQLISDAIGLRDRHNLSNQAWMASFLPGKPIEELGWRMGERYMKAVSTLLTMKFPKQEDHVFFSQQYFEKVLKPLDINDI